MPRGPRRGHRELFDGPIKGRLVVGGITKRVDAVERGLHQRAHAFEQPRRVRGEIVLGEDRRPHGGIRETRRQLVADASESSRRKVGRRVNA